MIFYARAIFASYPKPEHHLTPESRLFSFCSFLYAFWLIVPSCLSSDFFPNPSSFSHHVDLSPFMPLKFSCCKFHCNWCFAVELTKVNQYWGENQFKDSRIPWFDWKPCNIDSNSVHFEPQSKISQTEQKSCVM